MNYRSIEMLWKTYGDVLTSCIDTVYINFKFSTGGIT